MDTPPPRFWGCLALFIEVPQHYVNYFTIGFTSGEPIQPKWFLVGERKKRPVTGEQHLRLLAAEAHYAGFDTLSLSETKDPREALSAGIQMYTTMLKSEKNIRSSQEMRQEANNSPPYYSLDECLERFTGRFFAALHNDTGIGNHCPLAAVREIHDFALYQPIPASIVVTQAKKQFGVRLAQKDVHQLREAYLYDADRFHRQSVDFRKTLNDKILKRSYLHGSVETIV